MTALSSSSGEWQTPQWLVEKCRAALGGYISLDAASSPQANETVKARCFLSPEVDALETTWDAWERYHGDKVSRPTLFLNPPGERSGKLIRKFWAEWDYYYSVCGYFYASVWVDFNLDHLRFIHRVQGDCLIIPRKRMAFVDPTTGKEKKGAQIGGFILFRGGFGLESEEASISRLFPKEDFLVMWGEP